AALSGCPGPPAGRRRPPPPAAPNLAIPAPAGGWPRGRPAAPGASGPGGPPPPPSTGAGGCRRMSRHGASSPFPLGLALPPPRPPPLPGLRAPRVPGHLLQCRAGAAGVLLVRALGEGL